MLNMSHPNKVSIETNSIDLNHGLSDLNVTSDASSFSTEPVRAPIDDDIIHFFYYSLGHHIYTFHNERSIEKINLETYQGIIKCIFMGWWIYTCYM